MIAISDGKASTLGYQISLGDGRGHHHNSGRSDIMDTLAPSNTPKEYTISIPTRFVSSCNKKCLLQNKLYENGYSIHFRTTDLEWN